MHNPRDVNRNANFPSVTESMLGASNKLHVLTPGHQSEEVIVTVDFALFSTVDTLGSVMAKDNRGHKIVRLDAVSDLARHPGYRSLTQLAHDYAESLADLGAHVALIAGHCSGAALATHLAAEIATDSCRPPTVALVAPTWPTLAGVSAEFAQLRRGLGAPNESGLLATPSDEPGAILRRADAVLRRDTNLMCDFQELDHVEREVFLEQVVGRYMAWLSFLLASANSGPVWPGGALQVLSSREEPAELPHAIADAEHEVITVGELELLSNGDVPARLHALLTLNRPS
jgi:pimeloyl-ACP methyl ester carboxylesterase